MFQLLIPELKLHGFPGCQITNLFFMVRLLKVVCSKVTHWGETPPATWPIDALSETGRRSEGRRSNRWKAIQTDLSHACFQQRPSCNQK